MCYKYHKTWEVFIKKVKIQHGKILEKIQYTDFIRPNGYQKNIIKSFLAYKNIVSLYVQEFFSTQTKALMRKVLAI